MDRNDPYNVSVSIGDPPDPPFVPLSIQPEVKFLSRGVQPPSQVYVTKTDVLQVGCASSQAGEALTVNYRLLIPDGHIVTGQDVIQVAANRAVTVYQIHLAEGFLLSVSCKAAVATTRGQTFARLFLTRGGFGPGQPAYMLMADYVTTAMAPAHPNGRVLAPTEGPGWTHLVSTAFFPVGTEFSFMVPTNARWAIKAMSGRFFAANAGVARFVGLEILSGGTLAYDSGSIISQNINTTVRYGASGFGTTYTADVSKIPLAVPVNLVILAGDVVQSSTTNLNAADQWQVASLYVEEWLDNV